MDSLTFLEKILPRRGHYVLAVLFSGSNRPPQHKVVDDIGQLNMLCQKFDANPTAQVYHACATYKERSVVVMRKGKEQKAVRVAKNAGWIRSQWLDVDVGPDKTYKTRKMAIAALKEVCSTLHIPMPLLVMSGTGLHCYWVFDSDISVSEHIPIAGAFKQALEANGFDADDSRTSDMASILRPVGSHHKKGDPTPVTLLRDQKKPIPYTWWVDKFSEYLSTEDRLLQGSPVEIPGAQTDWVSGVVVDGEFKLEPMARQCHAMAKFIKKRGNVSRDYWRAALGTLKCVEHGEEYAHKFSAGHPDYTYEDTQHELDNWSGGAAFCTTFAKQNKKCKGCKHYGKINSPISLGRVGGGGSGAAKERHQPLQFASPEDYANVIPDPDDPDGCPFYPHQKYKWNGDWLFMLDYASKKAKEDGDDKQWLPIGRTLYYPYMRFRNDDGTYGLKICVRTPRGTWRRFDLDTKYVGASTAEFGKIMAVNEVTVLGQENNHKHYINDVLRGLQDYEVIAPNYDSFGWHHNSVEEDITGLGDGFVIGNSRLTGSKEVPVMVSKSVPKKLVDGLSVKGTAGQWTDLVDRIYNRPGAEAYQFVILCGIAAPLVPLIGVDSWRGIPTALTGASGLGKSMTCMVAISFYGAPEALMVSANKGGATLVGLLGRIAMHQHLPIIFDELTGTDTATAQQLLYSIAHGEPKIRGNVDGSERINNKRWATTSFVTSNESITSLLTRNSDQSAAEATQVRCFEIALPDDYNKRVFSDVDGKDLIEQQLLSENYGAAGREFLQYVINNRDKVSQKLRKDRIKLAEQLRYKTTSKERFYVDLISLIRVAGSYAKQLGLITFDIDQVEKWAINHIYDLRTARTATLMTPEDFLQQFFSDIHHGIIRTKKFGDGRSKAEFVDEAGLRNPIGRIATEDKVFLVTKTAFSKWCKENAADEAKLLVDWEAASLLLPQPKDDRERITKGTNLPGTQVRCLHFNYDVVMANKPPHLSAVPNSTTQTGP